ncbi:MAG TPA: outer membrane protein assembly factor BamA [Hypericibacter adhaerens]|uniref:Outer membrane protein assembly factor BamA n=1 Tax=Hypericibacter adhaerens TaxID=2602016 RepID=A0A5J6MYV6_9PROT|nr:outer membrane protein assembly factor BamA [Hypericibacter adhaerens]QEX22334.1 outer membrane protein assembly factor BamA [Hypericibacter adhaerens]HWA46026.1 outer membrane protein assembly factor BamA [Hypericibacter adhaerens]
MRVWCKVFLLALGLFLTGGLLQAVHAQDFFTGEPISDIRVEGNQRIESETVRSYMQISPGDPFEPVRVDRALKALFATGLFADVTFQRDGRTLVVVVKENPIINELAFEGNDRIDDKQLQSEVQLRPRTVYTQTRVQEDTKRILELYRRSGRYAATVEPKVIPLDQNRVNLVFEINEGSLTTVERIDFVGNKAFSDSTLRDQILTKETAFYRFLTNSDIYDPDRLAADQDALTKYYTSNGYADFEVVSAVAELSSDLKSFFITFTVDEGDLYNFGKINVDSRLKDLDPETLQQYLETSEGDTYDSSAVQKSIDQMTTAIGTLGYAFVKIEPRLERATDDKGNKIINLTYVVEEGPRVFVNRIDITGNVRTLDKVIRREFRISEGDAFNSTKLTRTRQRIQNLGFFSKVDISAKPADEPDKIDLAVNVEEQSTGELTFGIGYSTGDGPLGQINLRERNLLGLGQDLRLDFTISGRNSQVNLSYTDPYFMDEPIAAGVDAFRTETDRSESSFQQSRLGGGLRAAYDIQEYLRQTWRYRFTRNDIYDVDNDASLAIKQQKGVSYSSLVGQDLIYDRRDNRFDPRTGYYLQLSTDFSGLGGDVYYAAGEVYGGYYYTFLGDITASAEGQVGYIQGVFGDDVRIIDSFSLGGNTFRGFKIGGLGPRDRATGDFLGGNMYYVGSIQLAFPLGLPEEYQIRGRVFSDFGSLWNSDLSTPTSVDENVLRVSIGSGITWKSPFGPIAVDLAYPIVKQDYDKEEYFRFSVGTRF